MSIEYRSSNRNWHPCSKSINRSIQIVGWIKQATDSNSFISFIHSFYLVSQSMFTIWIIVASAAIEFCIRLHLHNWIQFLMDCLYWAYCLGWNMTGICRDLLFQRPTTIANGVSFLFVKIENAVDVIVICANLAIWIRSVPFIFEQFCAHYQMR